MNAGSLSRRRRAHRRPELSRAIAPVAGAAAGQRSAVRANFFVARKTIWHGWVVSVVRKTPAANFTRKARGGFPRGGCEYASRDHRRDRLRNGLHVGRRAGTRLTALDLTSGTLILAQTVDALARVCCSVWTQQAGWISPVPCRPAVSTMPTRDIRAMPAFPIPAPGPVFSTPRPAPKAGPPRWPQAT